MKHGDEVYLKVHVMEVRGDWVTVNIPGMGEWDAHVKEVVIPTLKDAEFRVGRDAPATSKAVEPRIREGSLQERLLRLFDQWPQVGFTDDELETITGLTHQSVSACRNTLMRKGLIEASGFTRETRSGNEAIVWRRSPVEVTS